MQPEQLTAIVIKADPEGRVTRLRDVVSGLELGAGYEGFESLDGKDAAVLAIYPVVHASRAEVSEFVRARLSELRPRFPEGLSAFTGFDFSREPTSEAPGYLVLDVDPPAGTSAEMTESLLNRGEQVLQRLAGVRTVLAISEQTFDLDHDQPCLVVGLGQKNGVAVDREQLIADIRREIRVQIIAAGRAAAIGVRDLSGAVRFPGFRYPIAFAICGPERRVRELAGQMVARMSRDPRLMDVRAGLRTAPALPWTWIKQRRRRWAWYRPTSWRRYKGYSAPHRPATSASSGRPGRSGSKSRSARGAKPMSTRSIGSRSEPKRARWCRCARRCVAPGRRAHPS